MQDLSFALEVEVWAGLVARLGGAEALELSAREHGALLRKRGVKSAEDLLRLLLAYGPGGRSLRVTAAEAAARGMSDISDVAWMKRFGQCGAWLTALCARLLAGADRPSAAGADAPAVRLVDGSRIAGPGDSCWRLHLCWDASRRRIAQMKVTTLAEGERLDVLAPQAGEIRLGDCGFPQPNGLRTTRDAGADVLVRLTWNSLRLLDAADRPLDWTALFARCKTAGGLDITVSVVKPRGRSEPLPLRLVILPKPAEVVERACRRARRAAAKEQRAVDPRSLASAEHMILLTSLSVEAFPPDRLYDLYRVRWQIELAFKRLKSILRLDRLPAKSPGLAQAWIAAHLLIALLVEDTAAELAESFP